MKSETPQCLISVVRKSNSGRAEPGFCHFLAVFPGSKFLPRLQFPELGNGDSKSPCVTSVVGIFEIM